MKDFDVIIAGGGAAGLMCAITAGNRGRRVAVLEGSNKIGKKILMSGGGRCNFTNLHCEPARFISSNPSCGWDVDAQGFLKRLALIVGPGCLPIVVTDAGFRVWWYE